jgi:hypothetical protein
MFRRWVLQNGVHAHELRGGGHDMHVGRQFDLGSQEAKLPESLSMLLRLVLELTLNMLHDHVFEKLVSVGLVI